MIVRVCNVLSVHKYSKKISVVHALLRFSQTCELQSSKAPLTIAFFAAINHNYDHKQRTLKHRNTQNGSGNAANRKSQTMTFWTPLRWLTAAKNSIVSWLLNFRIRMFSKSAATVPRKLHSSFLLSPKLSCGKTCRQVTHASKSWLYRMFIILPSNHQNISRNSIWLANDTEYIVGHKTRVHCPFAKALIPLIVNT